MEKERYLNGLTGNSNMAKRGSGKVILITAIVIILAIAIFYFTSLSSSKSQNIRLGYMTLWAEGAFPAEALQQSGIAEKNNLNISTVKVQYGPPLVEAALADKVDIIFTGWVPAVTLMSKSDDWVIVSKLAYFPMALMARNGSNIYSVEELRGKKVGVGFGTGPYPLVLNSLENANLTIGKDVEVINMPAANMGAALKTSQIDAISWAEPSITLFTQQGLAYSIVNYTDIGFVVVSKKYLDAHPDDVKRFLKAFKESELYVAQNKKQVYNWFSAESQYNLTLVNSLIFSEPNFNANSLEDIDLQITPAWINETQKKIDFEYNQKIISKNVNLAERIDLRFLP